MVDETTVRDTASTDKQIGNYRIIKELSPDGGFGRVFLGRHIVFADQPPIVIKVLRPHLASEDEKKRFLQEAHFLKMLKHAHILPIIEAGIQDDVPYLIVEYASGGSLKDILRKQTSKPLPMNQIIAILRQVGMALHYMHFKKVVHRDLKPDNILFDVDGKTLLADLGIAVILEKTGLVDTTGTPPYMAPEQFKGKVSRRSDLYALACIAYELITGHRVFSLPKGSTWWAWADKHINEDPIPPRNYNPHLSSEFEQTVLKGLAKDYEDRQPDIFTFIAQLQTKEEWLTYGNTYYEAQSYEDALEIFEYAIYLDENYTLAHSGKANTLYSLKLYEEALDSFDRSIQLDPNNALNWHRKGIILRLFEHIEEAKQAQAMATQLDIFYKLDEINRLLETGYYDEAVSMLSIFQSINAPIETLVRQSSPNLVSNITLVRRSISEKLPVFAEMLFDEKGKFEEAKRVFRLASEIDNLHADEYLAQLGNCYLRNRNYSLAREVFSLVLSMNPMNWLALLGQSECERSEGKLLTALQFVEIAMKITSDEYQLWNQRGVLFVQLERYEEALADFEKALKLCLDDPVIVLNIERARELFSLSKMRKR